MEDGGKEERKKGRKETGDGICSGIYSIKYFMGGWCYWG
jgi:hypothetical protein